MRGVESPRDLPALREALAEIAEIRAALAPAGADARMPESVRRLGRIIRQAELYWVTRDMTRLALDGSHDLPEWTPASARPESTGLLVWQEPLPLLTPRDQPRRVRVPLRGVLWATDITADRPSVMLALLTDAVAEVAPRHVGDAPMVVCDTISMPLHESPRMLPDDLGRLPEAGPVMALVGATWIMMQEPKVVERRTVEPARRDVDRAVRMGGSHPLVTTIDLRTLRTVHDPDRESESGRRLTVRHIVRGHWRQQWYASDGSHRPKFIAPYVKGDPSLPLALTEHVMVWRR